MQLIENGAGYSCVFNSFEGFPPGVTVGYAKSHIKDILKAEFNRSVELQVNETYFQE